jgi:osmotically-inducible protein OsmY
MRNHSNRNNQQGRSYSNRPNQMGSRTFRDSSYDRAEHPERSDRYQDRDSSRASSWRPDEEQDYRSDFRADYRTSDYQSDYPSSGSAYGSSGSAYGSSGSAYGTMGRDSEYSEFENRPSSRRSSYESDAWGASQGSRGAGYNQGFNYGSTTGFNSGSTYNSSAGNTYGRSQDAMTDADHYDRNSANRWDASRSPSDRSKGLYGASSYGSEQGYGQSFGQHDLNRGQYGQGIGQSYQGRGPKSFKRTDDRIKEEVNEMLMRDHAVDAQDIEVEVKDGEVTLTGSVPERRMKHLAEECIERCYGVKEITNQLRVKSTDSFSSEGRSMSSSSKDLNSRDSSSMSSGSTSSSRKSSGSASSLS